MGDPQNLKSTQHILGHINGFTDDKGDPQTVDAVDWSLDDTTVGAVNVSGGGMDVDFVPVDMAIGDAPKTTVLRMHVTENGVVDAITDSWDMMVSAPASPLATRANVSFGAPIDK